MKLVVAGPTGFIATEIIAQALSHPAITSVVALGRRAPPEPQHLGPGADASKLESVLLQDFDKEYPEDVKRELAGVDAVIWYCSPPQDFLLLFLCFSLCPRTTLGFFTDDTRTNRTIAVSPSQSKTTPREEILKVCRDFPIKALHTIAQLPRQPTQPPARFLYLSSHMAEHDPNKKSLVLGEYALLRVRCPSLSLYTQAPV
jgi:hypothetical protein